MKPASLGRSTCAIALCSLVRRDSELTASPSFFTLLGRMFRRPNEVRQTARNELPRRCAAQRNQMRPLVLPR
jgi:hypothetical protein